MGKKSKPPKAPDPNKVAASQTALNRDAFQYQLDQQRVDSTGADGSTANWTQTQAPGAFDQAGYDAAMAAYKASLTQPAKPTIDWWNSGGDGEARYSTAQAPSIPVPTREQFTSGAGAPQWSFKESLSAPQQALYDRALNSYSSPADFSGIQRVDGSDRMGAEDFARGLAERSLGDNFNNETADATYGLMTRYLDPDIQRQQQAIQARLGEQGFVPGTPGYAEAMEVFGDTTNRAYGQARDSSVLAGYAQGNTKLGIQGQIAELLNRGNTAGTGREALAQTSQIGRMLQERNQSLDDFTGMRGALPPAQTAFNTPGMGTANIQSAYGDQYNADMARYNASASRANSLLGTAAGLGAAYLTGGGSLFTGLGAGAGAAGAITGGSGFMGAGVPGMNPTYNLFSGGVPRLG